VDRLVFRFKPDASQVMAALLSGECDVATADTLGTAAAAQLIEAEQNGILTAFMAPGTVFEHLDFGINPAEAVANERADWFEDVRVRQAFVLCTDRQAMVDQLQYGRSAVIDAYVPQSHPLFPADATLWPYDPARANALFDSANYLDDDGDGVRDDPATGRRFVVKLQIPTGNDMDQQIAALFKEDLAGCGVDVQVEQVDGSLFFADGPDGTVFGRRFQLASFPWLISQEPNCALYISTQIPGPDNSWNRSFNNNTGFTNGDFDAACQQALTAVPGMPEYERAHQQALRIWTEQVPVIPLFMRLKVAAARPEVRNFTLDATQPTELWNLAELDLSE
jgi:peptide/nickel transport system substrate-binding protein